MVEVVSMVRYDGPDDVFAGAKAFKGSEFVCEPHGYPFWMDATLLRILQQLRDKVGKPVTITSGYRTPAHNKAVGGATSSQHLTGRAADLRVAGMGGRDLAPLGYALGIRRIGVASGFVHLDTAPGEAYWKYLSKGTAPLDAAAIEAIKQGAHKWA